MFVERSDFEYYLANLQEWELIASNKLTGGGEYVDAIASRMGVRIEMRIPGRPTSGK